MIDRILPDSPELIGIGILIAAFGVVLLIAWIDAWYRGGRK